MAQDVWHMWRLCRVSFISHCCTDVIVTLHQDRKQETVTNLNSSAPLLRGWNGECDYEPEQPYVFNCFGH